MPTVQWCRAILALHLTDDAHVVGTVTAVGSDTSQPVSGWGKLLRLLGDPRQPVQRITGPSER